MTTADQTKEALAEVQHELDEIGRLAEKATPGPWCIESVGEKGDGSNMIGVAYAPEDIKCERPLTGWLRAFTDAGVEIDYYRDTLVCVVDHSEQNQNHNAAYIAACSPERILALLSHIKSLEAGAAELRMALEAAHGALQQAYTSKRLARLDAPTRTRLQSASWAASNALTSTSAGSALVEEMARLRGNQRNPGAVEKCMTCGVENDGDGWPEECDFPQCPLRQPSGGASGG